MNTDKPDARRTHDVASCSQCPLLGQHGSGFFTSHWCSHPGAPYALSSSENYRLPKSNGGRAEGCPLESGPLTLRAHHVTMHADEPHPLEADLTAEREAHAALRARIEGLPAQVAADIEAMPIPDEARSPMWAIHDEMCARVQDLLAPDPEPSPGGGS